MSFKEVLRNKRYFDFFWILIPLTFFYITTRFKILNPRTDGWLSDGDGTYEIAWEFYRNTPFPFWLTGNLDSYGLDMARPSFYVLPTLFAWPGRFFSIILGDRFQFIGLMVLLNLILHFYFSNKIFSTLDFSKVQSYLASSLLLTAPILHYRYIDHTHYTLTSNWIILFSIYLVLRKDTSWLKWSFLIISSLLIFPYYALIIGVVGALFFLYQFLNRQLSLKKTVILFTSSAVSLIFSTIISGYFFFGNSIEKDTELIWSSNLNALFDPSGWSRIMSDRLENPGNYEGFAFLGFNFLLITLLAVILTARHLSLSGFKRSLFFGPFLVLFIAALLLFFVSLSRTIYWDDKELFRIENNWFYDFIELNFRSPGRFVWLLVYLIMIYSLFKVHQYLGRQFFISVLIVSIILGVWETWPKLTSQVNSRFSLVYENPLKSKFWQEISQCYKTIVSVPTVTTAELLYPIAKIAYPQKMSIYPANIPRVSPNENFFMMVDTRLQIRYGNFDPKSIYVFQNAQFVIESIVEEDKKIAINTMSEDSRAGIIDGIFVLAPSLNTCSENMARYSEELTITKQYDYGIDNSLDFQNNEQAKNYLLAGWSDTENDGVWSVEDVSSLLVQKDRLKTASAIKIAGRDSNLAITLQI